MSNVVHLFGSEEESSASGDAVCIGCKHEWVVVAPVGTTQLECPECFTHKGVFKFPYHLSEGSVRMVCNCGNDLHLITIGGYLCVNCGNHTSYDR